MRPGDSSQSCAKHAIACVSPLERSFKFRTSLRSWRTAQIGVPSCLAPGVPPASNSLQIANSPQGSLLGSEEHYAHYAGPFSIISLYLDLDAPSKRSIACSTWIATAKSELVYTSAYRSSPRLERALCTFQKIIRKLGLGEEKFWRLAATQSTSPRSLRPSSTIFARYIRAN